MLDQLLCRVPLGFCQEQFSFSGGPVTAAAVVRLLLLLKGTNCVVFKGVVV